MSTECRAPVQRDKPRGQDGTVSWEEHQRAWVEYDRLYRTNQSATRIAERGGFSFRELTVFLGHEPKTWEPR